MEWFRIDQKDPPLDPQKPILVWVPELGRSFFAVPTGVKLLDTGEFIWEEDDEQTWYVHNSRVGHISTKSKLRITLWAYSPIPDIPCLNLKYERKGAILDWKLYYGAEVCAEGKCSVQNSDECYSLARALDAKEVLDVLYRNFPEGWVVK